ncbi:MAG: hypothetical protein CMB51_03405 [Euryarchaeota archaeon]|nr:hypothetical protein [Euryarchaeota archaeon]
MGAALTVERVAAGHAGITCIHLSERRQTGQVHLVDGSRVAVELVARTEQTVEFLPARCDVFPRDDRGFGRVVKRREDVLRLQVGRVAVGLYGAQRSQRKEHDCG